MDLKIKFRNEEQRKFFWHTERNAHFGGGFGNGKSYVACQRGLVHLLTFQNYGMVFARQTYKRLRQSTMKTLFKICPASLIVKHDEINGFTVFLNKSFIYWMHLDTADEQDLRGLEINSVCIDQGEEVQEALANVLEARVGRWDAAKVPNFLLLKKVKNKEVKEEIVNLYGDPAKQDYISELLFKYSEWPKDPFGERFLVPNYFDVLSNPSEEDELHWIWQQYNPASPNRIPKSFHIERKTQDELNDPGSIARILSRDQEFVDKYYYGKTGSPRAVIHHIHPLSIIKPSDYTKDKFIEFIKQLLRKSALYRILDHGETGVTAAGWEATYKNVHIFYREYYKEGGLISQHRKAIHELSSLGKQEYGIEEEYAGEYADPAIFKAQAQKQGGFFCVADEYSDVEGEVDSPPIHWSKADNNEFATRNRINELLKPSPRYKHPITEETPAPGIYFIEADADIYPHGIVQMVIQTRSQKRVLLGTVNGKNIYSEERDDRITDHSYDLVRYDIGQHNIGMKEEERKVPKRSFAHYNKLLKAKMKYYSGSTRTN